MSRCSSTIACGDLVNTTADDSSNRLDSRSYNTNDTHPARHNAITTTPEDRSARHSHSPTAAATEFICEDPKAPAREFVSHRR